MIYRNFPDTDLRVSAVGLGCWAIGGKWWGEDITDEDSIGAVRSAVENGINFFDTAPLYGHGHADRILVKALGSRRHDMVIATKVGIRFHGRTGHAESQLDAQHIREDTEESLRRLQLDTIPLMQVHWPCELGTPIEETMEALVRLKEEGKIRYVGVCNYNREGLDKILSTTRIHSFQTPLSMVRKRFGSDLQEVCLNPARPIGVIAYEPLCRGLLTGKYKAMPLFPPGDVRAQDDWFKGSRYLQVSGLVRMLEQVGKKVGTTPAALAIAWSANQPGVTTCIAGAKRANQVQNNASACRLLEKEKLMTVIEKIVSQQPTI